MKKKELNIADAKTEPYFFTQEVAGLDIRFRVEHNAIGWQYVIGGAVGVNGFDYSTNEILDFFKDEIREALTEIAKKWCEEDGRKIIKQAVMETIEFIAKNEGWEESKDYYMKKISLIIL